MSSRRLISACALWLALAAASAAAAEASRLRFAVRFPASLEKGPLDGRLLLLLSTDPSAEPRFQVSDTNVARSQQVLRHRRRGLDGRGRRPCSTRASSATRRRASPSVKAGAYRVQALLHRYETFHRADGHVVKLPMDRGEGQQWSRAPGNLLSTPREIAIDPARDEVVRIELEKAIPEIPAPDGHEVRQARADPERAPDEVLGSPHAPRGRRPPAPRLRRAPRGALPARGLPRPLPVHLRRLPRGAARLPPALRVLRALPPRLLQPDPAGAGAPALPGLDGPGLPALHRHPGPAREPLLRRLLRGELREPRALRGRHPVRARPVRREDVPRPGPGLGPLHVRGVDRGLGGARRAGPLPGRVERLLGRVPRPDRLPRVRDHEPLRGQERVLGGGALRPRGAAGPPQLARPRLGDPRAVEPRGARPRHEEPLGGAVRHLGGGLLAGGDRTATRSGSSTSARA